MLRTTKNKSAAIAKAIKRDLLADRPDKYEALKCVACGRGYMARPPSGDDSTRFCSTRCREAYDAGFPAWDKNVELNGHHQTPLLTGWSVIVGPPGTVGSNPWQSVIDASEKKRRKIEKRKNRENKAAKSKASKRAKYESTNGPSVHFKPRKAA
jgi:hypothetical protein